MSCSTALVIVGGAMLLIGVGSCLSKSGPLRTRFMTGGWWQALQKTRRIERFFYRHHRLFGAFIAATSLVPLFVLGIHVMSRPGAFTFLLPGIQLIEVAVLAFALATLSIGIFVAIRPSALKSLEEKANLWIDIDQLLDHRETCRTTSRVLIVCLLLASLLLLLWTIFFLVGC